MDKPAGRDPVNDLFSSGRFAQADVFLAVCRPDHRNGRVKILVHRVLIGVGKVPPLGKIGLKSVLFHGLLQKRRVPRRLSGAVAVIPVGVGREIVKARGHGQLLSRLQVHQRHIHRVAPAVCPPAGDRVGDEGRVRADLPQLGLRRSRAKAVPYFQPDPLPGQLLADLGQLFHRAVAQIGVGKIIDPLSGEIVHRGIGQRLADLRDIVQHPDQLILRRLLGFGRRDRDLLR